MVSPTLTRPAAPAVPTAAPVPMGRRWSLRRTQLAVTVAATVTALWLGLTAPKVSPVTPMAPPAAVAPVVAVVPVVPAVPGP